MKTLVILVAALGLLAACERQEPADKGGPAERAGRQLDRAMDKAGESVEQAGRNMQDAAKGKK
jgi:hypothetical protein